MAYTISSDQLAAIAGRATPLMPALAQWMSQTCPTYEIDTPHEFAHFLAQACHETDRFRTLREYASGKAYEGRADLGNTQPGDGVRFKGRGYIQITGRANYTAVSKAFAHDFTARPTDLALPRWAALASAWWWQSHGCNEIADGGDFVALTRRINGGTTGLADRLALHARARAVAAQLVPRRF